MILEESQVIFKKSRKTFLAWMPDQETAFKCHLFKCCDKHTKGIHSTVCIQTKKGLKENPEKTGVTQTEHSQQGIQFTLQEEASHASIPIC